METLVLNGTASNFLTPSGVRVSKPATSMVAKARELGDGVSSNYIDGRWTPVPSTGCWTSWKISAAPRARSWRSCPDAD